MCSSQDSKYFLPPTPMGAGDFSVPQAYQSNKEPTTDVGNTTPVPPPDQGYGSYPGGGGLLPPSSGGLVGSGSPGYGGPPRAYPGFGGGRFGGGSPFFGGMPFRGYPGLPNNPRFGGSPVSATPIKPAFPPSIPGGVNGFGSGFNRRMIFG